MRTLVTTLLLAGLISSAHAALPVSVTSALGAAGVPESSVSLWSAPLDGSREGFQHRISEARNPASVMKLLTTFAALDRLGPAFTWRTRALIDAPLRNGILTGNLYLEGGGDPFLTWDRLASFLRELRERGLREVRGDLVLDRSLFATEERAVGDEFDGRPARAYNAAPDALMVNFNALSLRLVPEGGAVRVSSMIPIAQLRLDNRLKLAAEGVCADWKQSVAAEIRVDNGHLSVSLPGRYAASCGEKVLNLAVPDSEVFAGDIVRALWGELGGQISGRTRSAATPSAALELARWQSPPLGELVRDINKFSNNVMARSLYLGLGQSDEGRGLRTANTTAMLAPWMRGYGLDPTQWWLENGSGLSRSERTTARELGVLLRAAWRSPRMPEYLASLPVLGVDGTVHTRLVGTPLAGRAYIKTGTLDGVKAAAGYLLDAQGRWQAFAWLINDPRASACDAALDALLWQLYSGAGK